jgi:hypothetical protein
MVQGQMAQRIMDLTDRLQDKEDELNKKEEAYVYHHIAIFVIL